jgi:translation initiation factor IF-2-like protein
MADQIRIVLTVDDAVKKMIEDSANEYCGGNTSAYVRGLVVLHHLLQNKDVRADIPGWMLRMYPLRLINRLSENIAEFHKSFAQKEFYERVAPPKSVPNKPTLQVRINELARELEVKATAIIDLLPGYGVTEKKTHSMSIPADVAEKVRKHLQSQAEAEAQAEAVAKAEKEAKEAAAKAARTK